MRINKAFAQLALQDGTGKTLENIVAAAQRESEELLRPLPRVQARYSVCFTNGVWGIFDHWRFRVVEVFDTQKQALRAAFGWQR